MVNKQKQSTATRPRARATSRSSVSRRSYEKLFESDGAYLLKLVLTVLLGMFWLRFNPTISWGSLQVSALPIGCIVGLLFVSRFERFQSDRKIWYAVLVIVTIVSYFFATGLIV